MKKLLFILLLPALAQAQPSGVKTNYGPSWFQQLYTTPTQVDVLDTTNYKVAVFNSNGLLSKSYWPSGGGGSQNLNSVLGVGNSSTNSILLTGNDNTTNSRLRVGSLEVQPYALNNVIAFDNAYFDGAFKYRANGTAMYWQFYEGQFNIAAAASGTAGANVTFNNRFNINTSGQITFNNAYTFPASIGSAGQALRRPAGGGTELEWFTPGSGGSSQWVDGSGGDIYYNSGYVGLNISDPAYPLHIFSSGNGANQLKIENTSTGSSALSGLWVASDGNDLLFNSYSSTSAGFGPVGASSGLLYSGGSGGLGIVANTGPLVLAGAGSTGNFWINRSSSINYINGSSTLGSSGYGFRNNSGNMEYKDFGGSWVAFNSLGGGGGSGTVTSVSGSGGSTGLTLTGGPITTTGTLTLGGTLAIANGGTGTSSPNLSAGSGISISGSWPNQTITNTLAATLPPMATFTANTSGSTSGDMSGSLTCGSGEAGYFVVHLNINRTDNGGHYWREFRVPFVRNTTTLTFPELEHEIFVGDDAGFTYVSTITLANNGGNLKITYNTNGGNLSWTAVVYKYYAVNAL